ncbi:MAG: hypothetical protein U1G07_15970 [Verrucomicrobiota bacterium]
MSDPRCPPELREAWQKIQKTVDHAADAVNFQQLAEASEDKAKMYYI